MSLVIDKQLCPENRIKSLLEYSSNVEIDPSVSAKLYYKSGLNMFRQFNIYYKGGEWENALCIYLKYEKLFFDKIRKHPEYNKIPVNVKSINAANFRIIKPKAEHAKRELFKQYRRDYFSFVEEMRANKLNQDELGDSSTAVRRASGSTHKSIQSNVPPPITPKHSLKKETIEKDLEPEAHKVKSGFEIQSEYSFETSRKITEMLKVKKLTADDEQKKHLEEKGHSNAVRTSISKSPRTSQKA